MRSIIAPVCGLIVPLLLVCATPAAAEATTESTTGERAAEHSAADRAVWDFVHFVSPSEVVDVIDAFDGDDPFDLSLSVAYDYSLRRAKITRECRNPTLCNVGGVRDDGAYSQFVDFIDIARYTQTVHTLDLLLVLGLYHDLQFYTRWPLILSDNRSLDYEAGTNHAFVDNILGGIFTLPFESPERSGIDYFTVGLSWAPFNQERDPTEPNWVLNVEGRFGIGELLQAASAEDGGGGESRGLTEIRLGMALSRRFQYIEPFGGLFALVGIPKNDTYHHFDNPVDGQINTMPPVEGTLMFGMDIIPWENLERFQKLWIGLEISGTFHSEGRTFSELFDALGSSDDCRLTYSHHNADGSDSPCYDSVSLSDPRTVFINAWDTAYGRDALYRWSGMTDIENYATFMGRLTVGIQAAKYVKFVVGVGFAHDQEHYITFTDECNSEAGGTCGGTPGSGQYNPMTREAIDAPGNRFRVQETTVFDVSAAVTAMF
ncbi:MAG: hypothetical protein HY905_00940 [Deltaproteobacteria bacterium]|nr:hypothetical protein [Deltaproteobacteria bacterium]